MPSNYGISYYRYGPSQSKLFRFISFLKFLLLFSPMSVSVGLCVPMPQEVIIEYDQTIAIGVGSASLKLVLPQVTLVHHHL
jgi:hypothetical protein